MLVITKQEADSLAHQSLNNLVSCAGDVSHLSRMIEVSPYVIYGWIRRRRISISGANKVLKNPTLREKFPLEVLRPDLDTCYQSDIIPPEDLSRA
jgi:hypothetical protein